MQKGLAILLISLHLAGNTEAGQLFRISTLFKHYHQHHQQDHSVGFLKFLFMHYAGDDGNNADNDMDNRLPFHNPGPNTLSVSFSPMTPECCESTYVFIEPRVYTFCPHQELCIVPVHRPMQPPRQA